MERFYMSAYTYGAIVYEIECRWGEIRNELDRMAEECGDYSKNYYTEFELWQKPTSELEEWLDENRGTGFEEDEIYYDLKWLDKIVQLYREAQAYTGWFMQKLTILKNRWKDRFSFQLTASRGG